MSFDLAQHLVGPGTRHRASSSKIPKRVTRNYSATETRQPPENLAGKYAFPPVRSATFVKEAATVPSFEDSEFDFPKRDLRTIKRVINNPGEYFFLFESAEEKEQRFRKIADEFSDWFHKEKENIRRNWKKYFAVAKQEPMSIGDLQKVKYVADNPEEYYFLFETEEEKERRYKKEKEGFQKWFVEEKEKVRLGTSRWSNRKVGMSEPKLDKPKSLSLPATPAKPLPNCRPRKLSPIKLDQTKLWREREGSGVKFPYRSQAIEAQTKEANSKLIRPKSSFRRIPTPKLPPLLNAHELMKKFEKPKQQNDKNDERITYKIVWKNQRFRPESNVEQNTNQIATTTPDLDDPEIDYVVLCRSSKMGATMHQIKNNFERAVFGDDGQDFALFPSDPTSNTFGIERQIGPKKLRPLSNCDRQKEKIRTKLVDTLRKVMTNNHDDED